MSRANLAVKVATVELASGKETDARTINYQRDGSRKWLLSHIHWCVMNGHGVQILHAEEQEPASVG